MEPFKNLVPVAKWLLRITVLIVTYHLYFDVAIGFKFNSASYFFALGLVVFAILLFFGGFLRKNSLTVLSGLIIFILSLINIFISFDQGLGSISSLIPQATIGFYFVARGNRG